VSASVKKSSAVSHQNQILRSVLRLKDISLSKIIIQTSFRVSSQLTTSLQITLFGIGIIQA
jgi:hypothetical protein